MSNAEKREAALDTGDLIVVGSSAGGIEALSVLIGSLAQDFPAPIVIAQHLDPTRPSTLHLILQRRTSLPIEVVNSVSPLRTGTIYVVPSNHQVSIKDHKVEVLADGKHRPYPSVDVLLSSAAECYGERLIAVILTGSGSDGAAGAVDVKNAGGTVVVQNPQTARYPSMPLALPPSVVDFEANIENMGALLYDLLTGVSVPQTEECTEDILRSILEQISRQASIDFCQYKTSTILRRIGRRMAVTHNRTMRDYAEYLKAYPAEVGELVKAFLINVTQFFRDADAFAYLKNEILPSLVARARASERVLRIWTAGCATGEEPYSLAMLLTDLLGAELPEWSVKIFATDLDEAAIAFARRGLYSENMLKGLPADYHNRFFERVEQGYRISKTLRQMVIFGQQDLSRRAPFPRIDLVLCRNVLIYFTLKLQDYVLNQFSFSLCPNGYLFLGKAETVRPSQSYFELVNKQWKVYRCVENCIPALRHQNPSDMSTAHLEARSLSHQNSSTSKSQHQESTLPSLEIGQLRRFNEVLLRFLPIGVVVIDRSYRILTANGAARRLLGLRDVSTEQDFLHSARGISYSPTRNAIDKVFRERTAVTLPEVELPSSAGGNGRFVSLSIALMQMQAGVADLATISVSDVTEQVQIRRQLETAQSEQTQLVNELGAANKRLSDVNKELVDSNEELQVANEELVLTHEELQASIEEFETTNEELQATNEELETNNEEMQATNEEFETNNDELQARTSELQELTDILESERVRLTEMVELAPFYILVLRGPLLLVEAYNPRHSRLLEERIAQGRPLEEIVDFFWEGESGLQIARLAREVYQSDKMRTTPRMHATLSRAQESLEELVESYFVYNIVPSHDNNDKVNGVIIYALDETEQRAQEVKEERDRLELIFDNMQAAVLALYDAKTAELVLASQGYLEVVKRTRGLQESDIIGRTWQELTVVTPSEVPRLWSTVLEQRTPLHVAEISTPSASGQEELVWDYTLTPILDLQNEEMVRFVLVSAIEITQQVQVRQELEYLDKLKDEFLSLATHELRTPLTSILGNAQMLQRSFRRQTRDPGSQQTKEPLEQGITMLEKIVSQASRMNRLIDEMLDVTRMQGNVFELQYSENVDIVAFVRGVVEQHTVPDSLILFSAEEDEICGTIDEVRIEQVLNNLVSNAIKYSSKGKPVTVTVERDREHTNEVIIAVKDDGFGIAQEDQLHIFDRFYRGHRSSDTKIDGLGLGLYIASEIVKQHGGRMWLESELGDGSTFYCSLPLERP